MSTHKYIERICCVILALSLVLTILFMNAENLGIQKASSIKGYETRLFDASSVHTVNIVIDNWEDFLSTCTNEEYAQCSVIIDNEAYSNVAIRAKGNTSLTQVQSYGNNRYSFKIEFDHYDSTKTYYGLDKLSLNNIIQDNTYMKDFLTYQMMGYFGVSAPLCSYVQILVNGEEWGLYLAVEGVEDSFLQRNYGNDYGELYKPDSLSMGGGRGNGNEFDMDDWNDEQENAEGNTEASSQTKPDMQSGQLPTGEMNSGQMPSGGTDQSESNSFSGQQGGQQSGQQGGQQSGQQGGQMQIGNMEITLDQIKTMTESLDEETLASVAELLGYEDTNTMLEALNNAEDVETFLNGKTIMELASLFMGQNGGFNRGEMTFPGNNGGGMGSMGSSDVSLIYSDDEYSSYSNIFDNAKTEISDADKDRLIASLKQLNENSNIEDIVNVEEVIRYFVVHNFVCNFDSYTGSMIHNYYLYEEDGQFSMIPWDYNLAFGGFVGGSDATSLVNYPIDSPVSGGTSDSRPMLNWIFENEEYLELYHQYFAEFISEYFDNGTFATLIDDVKAMISPYVESDPTKFCTYEEFETGIDTLKEFCLLRAESVSGQLDGTIAATSEEQTSETLISATHISISDMGSMSNSMGGGMSMPGTSDSGTTMQPSQGSGTMPDFSQGGGTAPDLPQGSGTMPDFSQGGGTMPDFSQGDGTMPDSSQSGGTMPDFPQGGGTMPDSTQGNGTVPDFSKGDSVVNAVSNESYLLFALSGITLMIGLMIALLYKKRA